MNSLLSELYDLEISLSEFNKVDLYTSGIKLFQAFDFPINPIDYAKNEEIKSFLYLHIDKSILFGIEEQSFLSKINSISLLFSINQSIFSPNVPPFKEDDFYEQILFIAIDIYSSNNDRSLDAHTITKIINKLYNHPIFILFYHNDHILFSSLVYGCKEDEYSGEVYLSDWYSCSNIDDNSILKLIGLSYGNHVQKNVKDFFYDITYSISRFYYIYPLSSEFVTYGCLCSEYMNRIIEDDLIFGTHKGIKELANENNNYYKNYYGEDYVDNTEFIELLSSGEVDWLLMLDDLEDGEVNGSFKGEEIDEDFENEASREEEMYLDDNPLNDPISMLKWLEDNNFEGEK